MKRRSYGRDLGLTLRMLLTTGLLGLLYVVFAVILFQVLNASILVMVVIIGALALFHQCHPAVASGLELIDDAG